MKKLNLKHSITLLGIILLCSNGFSQDLIVKIDDGEIIAKVTEISSSKIHYKEYENQNGGTFKIPKSEVELVIYEDGLKQYFTIEASEEFIQDLATDSSIVMFDRGAIDAKRFFNNNGPFWGTFAASAIPVYGIFTGAITGTVIGAVPPQVYAEDIPNPDLYYENQQYAAGYQKSAHRKKIGTVLKGFGLGMAVQTVFILIILSTW